MIDPAGLVDVELVSASFSDRKPRKLGTLSTVPNAPWRDLRAASTLIMLIKPAKADPYTPFWYQIEVDARGAEVQSPGGDTPLAGLDLILQKSQASTNTVLRTIVNVFETKQSPYRILIAFRAGVNPRFYQIAVADSLEELQRNLQYITDNIITGMRKLDEDDRETWALDKINALLASQASSSQTDETSSDAKVLACALS